MSSFLSREYVAYFSSDVTGEMCTYAIGCKGLSAREAETHGRLLARMYGLVRSDFIKVADVTDDEEVRPSFELVDQEVVNHVQ